MESQSSSTVQDIDWCTINNSLTVSKFPVTYLQMCAFVNEASGYENNKWWKGLALTSKRWDQDYQIDNYPVHNINWYTAVAFCRWLSSNLGYTVRLPLVSEWHYLERVSNFQYRCAKIHSNNYAKALWHITEVGSFQEDINQFGVCDLLGNVRTWCANDSDDFEHTNYPSGCWKSVCGGSFLTSIGKDGRCPTDSISPINIRSDVGVRLVRG